MPFFLANTLEIIFTCKGQIKKKNFWKNLGLDPGFLTHILAK